MLLVVIKLLCVGHGPRQSWPHACQLSLSQPPIDYIDMSRSRTLSASPAQNQLYTKYIIYGDNLQSHFQPTITYHRRICAIFLRRIRLNFPCDNGIGSLLTIIAFFPSSSPLFFPCLHFNFSSARPIQCVNRSNALALNVTQSDTKKKKKTIGYRMCTRTHERQHRGRTLPGMCARTVKLRSYCTFHANLSSHQVDWPNLSVFRSIRDRSG